VTGGFTHANSFCAPLTSSEQYNFDKQKWSVLDDLSIGRGDKVLVRVNDDTTTASDTQDDDKHSTQQRIYAIGGERQIENICNVTTDDTPEPGEETVPIDDVEYYNISTNQWTVIEKYLPKFRLRFAAVGYNNTIYTFGGQYAFNKTCQCFPTSNDVILYTELFATSPATNVSVPISVIVPIPAPVLVPITVHAPVSNHVPAAIPVPVPVPVPLPTPVHIPVVPVPLSVSVPVPVPVPVPLSVSAPVPVPLSVSAPVPVPVTVPANGTQTTSGSIPATGMTYAGVATVTIFSWLMIMAAIV
jgi:Kelch motif